MVERGGVSKIMINKLRREDKGVYRYALELYRIYNRHIGKLSNFPV